MDLEKLEEFAGLVLQDLNEYSRRDNGFGTPQILHVLKYVETLAAKVKNLLVVSKETMSEHHEFFDSVYKDIVDKNSDFKVSDAIFAVEHILAILEMEKSSMSKIKEMKIFESAEEKMKQAALSFRKEDYPSTFHNLNTALELVLKDKFGIPTTFTKINTSNIIDVLVKHKVEQYLYLTEARKRVLIIDNKIKHQGYSPSKIDCINGIKAMEELISKLRDKEIKLTEEIKNKIYEGL